MSDKRFTFRDGEGESRIIKLPVEALTFCFDFGPRLAPGETLTSPAASSTVLVQASGTTAPLTLTDTLVNAEEFTDESDPGRVVAVGEGVQVKVAGGTRGAQYELEVSATDTDGDIKAGRIRVDVI